MWLITLLTLIIPANTIIIERPFVEVEAEVSGYSSEESQTDSTPFLTAFNWKVRNGIVANNCYPKGTRVEIEGKQYEVGDRMNRRYGCKNFDIWFADYQSAKKFGRQEMKIKIYN